jgi:hypothetical protein
MTYTTMFEKNSLSAQPLMCIPLRQVTRFGWKNKISILSSLSASVEGTLLGDPDYSHSNQGEKNHPMDPSHLRKESSSWMEEKTVLQQSTQTDP